jgi:hypothetical protein
VEVEEKQKKRRGEGPGRARPLHGLTWPCRPHSAHTRDDQVVALLVTMQARIRAEKRERRPGTRVVRWSTATEFRRCGAAARVEGVRPCPPFPQQFRHAAISDELSGQVLTAAAATGGSGREKTTH